MRWRREGEFAIVDTECQRCHAIGSADMLFKVYQLTTAGKSNVEAITLVLATISKALGDAKVGK